MTVRFALSPHSDASAKREAALPVTHRSRSLSVGVRVRHGILMALLASAALSQARPMTSAGLRALPLAGLLGQTENVKPSESLKAGATVKHTIGEQSILGEGGQQIWDVHSDPDAAPPSELQFERSFLLEIPEAADRESLERRHDEH